ncbi:MAG: thioesterase, partial [Flavobacteriaceae bacterium]|nr:thioesterase [Flavobacteriaceae bacterium]
MATSVSQFNTYLFFKLPSAWWCGVRLKRIS